VTLLSTSPEPGSFAAAAVPAWAVSVGDVELSLHALNPSARGTASSAIRLFIVHLLAAIMRRLVVIPVRDIGATNLGEGDSAASSAPR
jgi:hypothetical protein